MNILTEADWFQTQMLHAEADGDEGKTEFMLDHWNDLKALMDAIVKGARTDARQGEAA